MRTYVSACAYYIIISAALLSLNLTLHHCAEGTLARPASLKPIRDPATCLPAWLRHVFTWLAASKRYMTIAVPTTENAEVQFFVASSCYLRTTLHLDREHRMPDPLPV